MWQSKKGCHRRLCARRAAARKEIRESLRSALPDTFWEHARASCREAKLAREAVRRAVKGQFRRAYLKKPATSQTIDIA